MTRLLLFLAAAASVAAFLGTSTSATSSTGCPPGGIIHKKVNGAEFYYYCGPARATTTFAGKTMTFKNGNCWLLRDRLAMNIGFVAVTGRQPPNVKYFSLGVLNPRRGSNTRNKSNVHLQLGRAGYFVDVSAMKLGSHKTSGFFAGKLWSAKGDSRYEGARISGKFNCNGGVLGR